MVFGKVILSEAVVGNVYNIIMPAVPQTEKDKLSKLGLLPGTKLKLVQKSYRGAVILELRGAKYALSSGLSSKIIVEKLN